MNDLIQYLITHMYIDFQGEISLEDVRQYLAQDGSKEAKALLHKLVKDGGVDDMLITIADLLKDNLSSGVTDEVVREQLVVYGDS